MTRRREAPEEGTLEDFLWEVDVTRRRPPAERPEPRPAIAHAAPTQSECRSSQPRAAADRTRRRIPLRRLAQLAASVVLLGGTTLLVVLALTR